MSVAVRIPPARISAARERAATVAKAMFGKANYDGQSGNAYYRYLCGYLGEEAIAAWLTAEGIPFEHRISFKRESLPAEFAVGRYTLEVKALGRPDRDSLVIGNGRDLSASAVVAARTEVSDIEAGEWEVVCWLPRAVVQAWPLNAERFGSAVREIPLAKAHLEMDPLAAMLRRHTLAAA